MNKELLQQKAEALYELTTNDGVNQRIMVARLAFVKGAKEILDNPELYGLVTKDNYEETVNDFKEVSESHKSLVRLLDIIINGNDAAKQASLCDLVSQIKDEYPKLKKENKELKEKATELETVIAKLSQRVINKSNY